MDVNAYRQRRNLELTAWETFVTRTSAIQHLSISAFGLLSGTAPGSTSRQSQRPEARDAAVERASFQALGTRTGWRRLLIEEQAAVGLCGTGAERAARLCLTDDHHEEHGDAHDEVGQPHVWRITE